MSNDLKFFKPGQAARHLRRPDHKHAEPAIFAALVKLGLVAVVSILLASVVVLYEYPNEQWGGFEILNLGRFAHFAPPASIPAPGVLPSSSPVSSTVLGLNTLDSVKSISIATERINSAVLVKSIETVLNRYLAEGRFIGVKGERGEKGDSGAVRNDSGQSTIVVGGYPLVTYIQPAPATGFAGGSLAGFTTLSSERLTAGPTTITGTLTGTSATLSDTLTVAGGATLATASIASLTVNGVPITSSGKGEVATGTAGSFAYYAASGATVSPQSILNISGSNIGIGTTTPGNTLTVSGSALITGSSTLATTTVNGTLTVNGNTSISSGGTLNVGDKIIAPGEIGLGTSTPSAKLALQNTSATQTAFLIYGTSTQSSPLLDVFDSPASGTNVFRITASGNVGINTSTPSHRLTVGGDINITGSFYQNGSPLVSSQWVTTGNDIYYSAGRVGVGSSTPTATLVVQGTSTSPTLNPFVVASSTGTQLLTVTPSGYVGIGTASPAAKLHIVSSGTGLILDSSAGSTAIGLQFRDNGTTKWNFSKDVNNQFVIGNNGNLGENAFLLDTISNAQFYGKVGVGNGGAPTYILDINPASGQSADLLRVASSTGSVGLVVKNSGNVGIGTSSPSARLSVSGGSVNVTGASSTAYQIEGVTVLHAKGSNNIFAGGLAAPNVTGDNNVALGYQAGYNLLSGNKNVFVGSSAGYSNSSGFSNVYIGYAASGGSSGNSNVHIGEGVGGSLSSSNNNVIIGQDAAKWKTSGGSNVILGNQAGLNSGSGANSVFLGYGAGYSETSSNKLHIANNTATTLLYGDFSSKYININTTNTPISLAVKGSGSLDAFDVASSSGTSFLRVTQAGNVGIGTTTPQNSLTVAGPIDTTASYKINNTIRLLATTNYTALQDGSGNNRLFLGNASDPTNYYDNTAHVFRSSGGSSEYMRITSAGNVGIGTTGPLSKLHVAVAGASQLGLQNTSSGGGRVTMFIGDTGLNPDQFAWNHDGSGILNAIGLTSGTVSYFTAGNVGIGTTSPSARLDVEANNSSGAIAEFRQTHTSNTGHILIDSPINDDIRPSYLKLTRGGVQGWDIGYGYGSGNFNISTTDLNAGITGAKVTVQSTGNVGIGTTGPTAPLTVGAPVGAWGGFSGGQVNIFDANRTTDHSGNLQVMTTGSQAVDAGGFISLGGMYNGTSNYIDYGGIAGRKENGTNGNTAGYLALSTRVNASALTERMRIDSTGNVGIGTSSPSRLLHLSSSDSGSNLGGLVIENTNNGSNAYTVMQLKGDFGTDTSGLLRTSSNNTSYTGSANSLLLLQGADAPIGFITSNQQRMIITNQGNVGIGTTSPSQLLTVGNNNQLTVNANGQIVSGFTNGDAFRAISGGTNPIDIRLGNTGNNLYVGTEGSTAGGFFTGSLAYASVLYSTTAIQNIIGGVSRMVIDTTGNVGIGTTGPAYPLDVSGTTIRVKNTGGSANLIVSRSANTAGATIDFNTGDTNKWFMGLRGLSDDKFHIYNNVGGNEPVTIDTSGNVGVGTAGPVVPLDVWGASANPTTSGSTGNAGIVRIHGSSTQNLVIGNTLNSGGYSSYSAWLQATDVGSGVSYPILLNPLGGNVGVGVANPANRFDVNGSMALGTYAGTNAAPANGMIISGNVGIGTTGPSYPLQVASGIYSLSLDPANGEFIGSNNLTIKAGSGNYIAFTDGSTENVRIDSNGNVGIGTTGPHQKLEVAGTGVFTSNSVSPNPTDGSGPALRVGYYSTDNYGFISAIDTGIANKNLALQPQGGNVGIGTTNPGQKLEVNGIAQVDDNLYLTKGTAPYFGTLGAIALTLGTGGVERMRIDSAGNVGIGTTTPGAKLHLYDLSLDTYLKVETDKADGDAGIKLFNDATSWTAGINPNNSDAFTIARADGFGANNHLVITTTGNVGIGTTTPTLGPLTMGSGAYVTSGGVWTNASDRNLKENFTDVNPWDILEKINSLPIQRWNYRVENASITHLGPTAQDFYSAFGLGGSETSVSTIDPAGVALLGIQALNQKIAALQGGLTGNLSADSLTVTQAVVFEGKITVKRQVSFSGDTVGEARILAGATSVRIMFSEPYADQPIVTVTPLDFVIAPYRVKATDATGFTLELQHSLNEDITFSWHAFGGQGAKLFVSDGSTQDIVLVLPEAETLSVPTPTPTDQSGPVSSAESISSPAPVTTSSLSEAPDTIPTPASPAEAMPAAAPTDSTASTAAIPDTAAPDTATAAAPPEDATAAAVQTDSPAPAESTPDPAASAAAATVSVDSGAVSATSAESE